MLESVPSVSIRHNPWTDLPAKWSKKYPARSGRAAVAGVPQHAAPAEQYAFESGYSSSDVLSLLYCARSVYPLAEKLFHQVPTIAPLSFKHNNYQYNSLLDYNIYIYILPVS